ncbi:hypothetical protein [Actinokineospora enzanensis]|uniref:SMODS-associated NUDIX domain-containing protein n=1 Tax=Actinokineospora enzanensis TaxID=155975 RepID=UPI00036E3C24|nr:hypothetical protein [Actinokineospora enzanensis]
MAIPRIGWLAGPGCATLFAVSGSDPRRQVRVSLSMLLRIREDERFVLFHSINRPGLYGPPSGVVKYFPPAVPVLEEVGFRPERTGPNTLQWADLRGFLPDHGLRDFLRWFESGAYRESSRECLVREFTEELGEVGLPHLAADMGELDHRLVRTVSEGPHDVPGKQYKQFRRFEVYDLLTPNTATLRLVRELVAAGADQARPLVVNAHPEDIAHGRHGRVLIAPQTALLLGDRRVLPDVPPMR